MKFVSFVHAGTASYGSVEGETVVDIGAQLCKQLPTLRSAIEADALADIGRLSNAARLKLSDVVLLPPIPDPQKIICVGLNYLAHAAEGGMQVPEHPSLFLRLTNTLVPHLGKMILPRTSTNFDFEGELAFVVGKGGRYIPRAQAYEHIFGYSCFNDGSIRDYQFKHSLTAGKNFVGTGGFGPWLVTKDEVGDPSRLLLTTKLNGQTVQRSGTDDLIFDIPTIVEYISSFTELSAGDVVATGTPHGVGFARKPPLWMKAGDVIEVEISNVGTLKNSVR